MSREHSWIGLVDAAGNDDDEGAGAGMVVVVCWVRSLVGPSSLYVSELVVLLRKGSTTPVVNFT